MTQQNTSTSQAIALAVQDVLRMFANHKHTWQTEQQTGHRVCGWCSACDEPGCDHYWRREGNPE